MAKAPTETDDIKTYLVDELGMEGEWSRLSKRKGADGELVRVFLNKDDNSRWYVVGDGGGRGVHAHYNTWEADGHIQFGIYENAGFDPEDPDPYETQFSLHFNTSVYWKANKCLYDQHVQALCEAIHGLPDFVEGEEMENSFSVTIGTTREEIMEGMLELGYVHSPEQETWVQSRG
jgi:hypothetical protein